jgi:hypothetical protein
MTKDEIALLRHVAKRGNNSCTCPETLYLMCRDGKCPVYNMCNHDCRDRPARAKEAQRLLDLHTSIIATEGEY